MLQACRGGGAYYGSYQVWMARYIIRTPIKQEMSEKGLEDEGSARTNTTFFSGLAEKRSSLPCIFFQKKDTSQSLVGRAFPECFLHCSCNSSRAPQDADATGKPAVTYQGARSQQCEAVSSTRIAVDPCCFPPSFFLSLSFCASRLDVEEGKNYLGGKKQKAGEGKRLF